MLRKIKSGQNQLSILIGFNVAMFLIIGALSMLGGPGSFEQTYSELLIAFGALSGGLVLVLGEAWRIITSIFLHVDPLHLAFNMLALFQLGRVVQAYYGGKLLFVFYILTGVGGSVLSIIFLDPRIPTVGASGAVFGLIGVLVAGSSKRTPNGIKLPFRPMDILPLAIYSFMFGLIPNSGINNFAHLGGFLSGLGLGWIFSHQMDIERMKLQRRLQTILIYSSLLLVLTSYLAVGLNLYLLFSS